MHSDSLTKKTTSISNGGSRSVNLDYTERLPILCTQGEVEIPRAIQEASGMGGKGCSAAPRGAELVGLEVRKGTGAGDG